MCTHDTCEQRIIELETRLTFQDDLLEQLNQVVTAQQQMLDTCTQRLKTIENLLDRQHQERLATQPGI